ncbi:hypothetical protein DRJ54_07350, partial [Candidatus Acetothermia bacterium]
MLLEDELGQVHPVPTEDIVAALDGLPRPLDLAVLNGCESASDARSVAQALVERGLARAAVGHPYPVLDPEAVRFAGRIYGELAAGYPLKEAVARAQNNITTHDVLLLGDEELHFEQLNGGEPWVEDGRPPGSPPSRQGLLFLGRGQELVQVAKALHHPPAVVVLSGPAGIGKTGLLIEATHRNAWRFSGGLAHAEGPATADALFRTLAERLKLSSEPGRETDALLEHTALQPTLLLLDNLESLPAPELERLGRFLRQLGNESGAIVALRPPCQVLERLPTAHPLPLHNGIGHEEAARYALELAKQRQVPLSPQQALEIAEATDGHPKLVELLVARARERDLRRLLAEVQERQGDFRAQLEVVYAWSADRLGEPGRAAWQALILFPAGTAPEEVLEAAAGGRDGMGELREAALADFDPALQAWRWHGTVAEYARAHWPIPDDERQKRLATLLPVWTGWLEELPEKETTRHTRLETALGNLEAVLGAARSAPWEEARPFLEVFHRALPAPDRTLSLREVQEVLYRLWARRAEELEEPEDKALASGMLGNSLSALGRREEALAATQEAVEIRRQLADSNPQAFLPDLAMSLNNLGAMLS